MDVADLGCAVHILVHDAQNLGLIRLYLAEEFILGEGFFRALRILVVTEHDIRAFGYDFALSCLGIYVVKSE